MEFEKYQQLAHRTFAELDSRKLEVAHMALGMCGEISELYEAIEKNDPVNIGEELTDINWFLANYLLIRTRIPYQVLLETVEDYEYMELHEDLFTGLILSLSKVTDYIKRDVIYGKKVDGDKLFVELSKTCKYLFKLYKKYGLDVHQCMENNIAKLKVRFPDKFTEEAAINRDLKRERVELEK